MSTTPDFDLERAMEQRCMEFETVLAWVDSQRDNWPVLRRELATLLVTKDPRQVEDYRACERELLDNLMIRMQNEIERQPATAELAESFRADAEAA